MVSLRTACGAAIRSLAYSVSCGNKVFQRGRAAIPVRGLGASEQGSAGEKAPGRETGRARTGLRVVVWGAMPDLHGAAGPGAPPVALGVAPSQVSAPVFLLAGPGLWADAHPPANLAAAHHAGMCERAGVVGADPGSVGSAIPQLRVRRLTRGADCTKQKSAPARAINSRKLLPKAVREQLPP